MDTSPYLTAIQQIPGSTPGEKYKAINLAAKKLAENERKTKKRKIESTSAISEHKGFTLPDLMWPFVQLEVARIMHQPEVVVSAIKSSDITLFNRALKVRWFFDGSCKEYTNAEYFMTEIFPFVSLQRREKLIRVLSTRLSGKVQLSEEFYEAISKKYGHHQVKRFLPACSEAFISNVLSVHDIELSPTIIKYLQVKYPAIIPDYFRQKIQRFKTYAKILPILLQRQPAALGKIIEDKLLQVDEMLRFSHVRLSKRQTAKFLNGGKDAVINSPVFYVFHNMAKISLEVVTAHLTKEQFVSMFEKLFPDNLNIRQHKEREKLIPKVAKPGLQLKFSFDLMSEYVKYFSEEQRVPLILSTFEKVYNLSLLECDELIKPSMLTLLPAEVRVEVARRLLEADKDWKIEAVRGRQVMTSWRCYLPLDESVPALKDKIAQTSLAAERFELLQQLLYTCKVNNDEGALLEVLNYIFARHKNEQEWMLFYLMQKLCTYFKLFDLSEEHWKTIDMFLEILRLLRSSTPKKHAGDPPLGDIVEELIVCRIIYNLKHNMPINDHVEMLFELDWSYFSQSWNVLKEYPAYERQCLQTMIAVIEFKYLQVRETQKDIWTNICVSLMAFMHDYDRRNPEAGDKLYVKNYPWLAAEIEAFLKKKNNKDNRIFALKRSLKFWEADLYSTWFPEVASEAPELLDVRMVLRKNQKEILDNWEHYFDKYKVNIYVKRRNALFFKASRWYPELPLKFVDKCLKEFPENNELILILAVLLHGPEFERVIAQFIPTKPVDYKLEDIKKNYLMTQSIMRSLGLLNHPLSFDRIFECCVNNMHAMAPRIKTLARHMPADKMIAMATELCKHPVSIQKQGLRLMRLVAGPQEAENLLMKLWRTEKSKFIRDLVPKNVIHIFHANPNENTWAMLEECVDGLTADDIDSLEKFTNFKKFSKEYIVRYIMKLHSVFKRIAATVDDSGRDKIISHIVALIKEIDKDIASLLPEEFHEDLMQEHFKDFSKSSLLEALITYFITNYLSPQGDNFESRLDIFISKFVETLKHQWTSSSSPTNPTDPQFALVKTTLVSVERILKRFMPRDYDKKLRLIEPILKSVFSVVHPHHVPSVYLSLTFLALFDSKISYKEVAFKIREVLPTLIELYSIQYLDSIAQALFIALCAYYDGHCVGWDNESGVYVGIVEGLLEMNDKLATQLAVTFMKRRAPVDQFRAKNAERCHKIDETLLKSKDPFVVTKMFEYLS